MNYNYDMMTYLQQMYQYLQSQQWKIEQLENSIEDLQNELNNLKKQTRTERIEYKFDQLKVEKLEGTLNIGITPSGGIEPTSFEDFTVNENNINTPATNEQSSLLFENIKSKIHHYLNNECYADMKSFEQRYNYQLDTPYRSFIVEDIKKQIDNRIEYYLNGINSKEKNERTQSEIEEKTLEHLKSDIHRTIEEFIKHLPQKGE